MERVEETEGVVQDLVKDSEIIKAELDTQIDPTLCRRNKPGVKKQNKEDELLDSKT